LRIHARTESESFSCVFLQFLQFAFAHNRCAGVPHSLYHASLLYISWVNTSHTARTHNPPPISGSMQISFIDHIFTSTKRASAKRQISACFKISRLRQPLRRLVVAQHCGTNVFIHTSPFGGRR